MQKTESTPLSLTLTIIYSNWIKDLNERPKTLKLLQYKVMKPLEDIGIFNCFLNSTAIAQDIRVIIDK
jgi:hypothetical protein